MELPLMSANDIEIRIGQTGETKKGVWVTLLLYKDARYDMRVLDEMFRVGGWQRSHEIIGGELYCNIDIWDSEKNCWVRKQDVGTESMSEKEKGRASDAFKRAGVNIGIGRELYTAPRIFIFLQESEYEAKDGKVKVKTSTQFKVAGIGYNDDREISDILITDKSGKVRFKWPTG